MIITFDIKTNTNYSIPFNFKARTEISTRLDYREIEDEIEYLGEGSFGIVFLGTYRGNKVAIKRMKIHQKMIIQWKNLKKK